MNNTPFEQPLEMYMRKYCSYISQVYAELDVFGQIMALAEALSEVGERIAGTTM